MRVYYQDLKNFINALPKIDYCKWQGNYYANVPMSFDIETSSFYDDKCEKKAIMYVWQFAIDDIVYINRTWNDFLILIDALRTKYQSNNKIILVIYVHNLSYEFQFIRKLFEWKKIFATDIRKPIYAITSDNIEFRCSYKLSGYSLATVANNLTQHKIKKLVGDLDYSKIRHSKTELSNQELEYCVNDVLIVNAYIDECINQYGSIANIPLTQTGKVRRFVRLNCLMSDDYKYLIRQLRLDEQEYLQLRKCFQGGFTHANAMFVNQICYDVTSFDFTSSYPTVMLTEKYPMSKAQFVGRVTQNEFEYYRKNFCCMFDLKLTNVRAKQTYENIISFSKCFRISNDSVLNNGRIFSCGYLITTVTEVDYESILHFYDFDSLEIRNLYIYKKDYLPKEFIKCILKLYNDKTTLKGVAGKEVEYLHSKEMLNSCYGMTVTDLLNNEYTLNDDNEWIENKKNVSDAIEKYNNDKNRFLFYPWGVWVTAYARRNLFSGIISCGGDYIYSDTDSIKIFNACEHMQYIKNYNDMIEQKLKSMCNRYNIDFNLCKPKTKYGKIKLIGIWDYDGHYKRFKTLGAKRYMTENDDNELSLTIAGVNKKSALPYLKKKYKNNDDIFNAFNDGLYFDDDSSGKKTLTYIDKKTQGVVKDYKGNENEYCELSSVHMENSEYCLSLASDYIKFIMQLHIGR